MKKIFETTSLKQLTFVAVAALLWIPLAHADSLDLSQEPLFLQSSVQPNILFVTDDSGSMNWEVVLNKGTGDPGGDGNQYYDFTPNNDTEALHACVGYNTMAYNPNRTYTPWKGTDENGTAYPEVTALTGSNGPMIDPYEGASNGWNRNIGNESREGESRPDIDDHMYFEWTDDDDDEEYDSGECPTLTSYSGAPSDRRDRCRSSSTNGCYVVGDLTGVMHGAAGNLQPAIQNYAQWYTYYRRRAFVAQRALTELAFNSDARMGLATLWNHNSVGTEIADMTVDANKTALLNAIGDISHANGTPLQRALYNSGRYFETGNGAAFGSSSTTLTSPILPQADGGACQQNFAIVMSDGYYNESFSGLGDEDGNDDSYFDGGDYAGSASNTLADIAMHFFETDLNTTLNDEVPESSLVNNGDLNNDMHQHLITYTVAFGVTGNLECSPMEEDCYQRNEDGELVNEDGDELEEGELPVRETWPSTISSASPDTVDDMWHAAVNGRGDFLSANNPDALIESLENAISDIEARNSASAAVAANSTSLNSGTVVYQARFNTGDWHGDLISTPVSFGPSDSRPGCAGLTSGTPCTENNWRAGGENGEINSQNYDSTRVIVTSKSTTLNPTGEGIPFRWPLNHASPGANELNSNQINALLVNRPTDITGLDEATYGQNLVNYLRGDQTNELNSDGSSSTDFAIFRLRENGVLGDIVNSEPKFVSAPTSGFPDSLEAEPYSSFVSANANRRKLVWVGANDGMLHAFNAESDPNDGGGDSVFAYIPRQSYDNIASLAQSDYSHQYFVDGSPTVGDVYFGGDWQTVILGSHRAGGQGVFALNITDPTLLTEEQSAIDQVFMWEFEDPDLGYTFGQPDIVRLGNGTWVAIFGNGYNNSESISVGDATSDNGDAYLFVVNIATGELIRKISTGEGSTTTPNGLATVTPVDATGNAITDYIYGGDLEGNMWRFDVRANNPDAWTATRLFTALAPDNSAQPITTRPSVAFHPDESQNGVLVYFGTGRYIDTSDASSGNQQTQTFYAIWDDFSTNGRPTLNRSEEDYYQRTILTQEEVEFDTDGDSVNDTTATVRITSDDDPDPINWASQYGWYMDLVNPDGNNYGERQVTDSIVRSNQIIFTTAIPDNVACNFGGTSFLMVLDSSDGSPLEASFDLDGDGDLDPASGLMLNGIASGPTIITSQPGGGNPEDPPPMDVVILNSSSGNLISELIPPAEGEPGSRTSWSEIMQTY